MTLPKLTITVRYRKKLFPPFPLRADLFFYKGFLFMFNRINSHSFFYMCLYLLVDLVLLIHVPILVPITADRFSLWGENCVWGDKGSQILWLTLFITKDILRLTICDQHYLRQILRLKISFYKIRQTLFWNKQHFETDDM